MNNILNRRAAGLSEIHKVIDKVHNEKCGEFFIKRAERSLYLNNLFLLIGLLGTLVIAGFIIAGRIDFDYIVHAIISLIVSLGIHAITERSLMARLKMAHDLHKLQWNLNPESEKAILFILGLISNYNVPTNMTYDSASKIILWGKVGEGVRLRVHTPDGSGKARISLIKDRRMVVEQTYGR